MSDTTDPDHAPRTKAERLAIAGEVAPILRRAAAAPRRVTLVGKDGKPTGTATHVDVARGLLKRAEIEFDVQPGKVRHVIECERCGSPYERTKAHGGRPSARCLDCRAPVVYVTDMTLSANDRALITSVTRPTSPRTWARVRSWLCWAAKAGGKRFRVALTQKECDVLDALAAERATRIAEALSEHPLFRFMIPELIGLVDGVVPRPRALTWSLHLAH